MEHDPTPAHDELGSELESNAEKMQERSDSLGAEIDGTRSEWHRKQEDSGVPGAEPARDPFEESSGDAEEEHERPEAAEKDENDGE